MDRAENNREAEGGGHNGQDVMTQRIDELIRSILDLLERLLEEAKTEETLKATGHL